MALTASIASARMPPSGAPGGQAGIAPPAGTRLAALGGLQQLLTEEPARLDGERRGEGRRPLLADHRCAFHLATSVSRQASEQ